MRKYEITFDTGDIKTHSDTTYMIGYIIRILEEQHCYNIKWCIKENKP